MEADESEMKTYRIRITRAVTQELYLEIEAEDKDAAIEEAEGELVNLDGDSDWEDVETRDDPEVDTEHVKELEGVGASDD